MTTATDDAKRVEIDLNYEHRMHLHGDIQVFQTWTMTDGRPCLVLIPAFAKLFSDDPVTPCVVKIDSAFLWDEHTGDPGHCARMSHRFTRYLGLNENDPRTVIRITSIIREHLGDLLMQPPLAAAANRVTVADATITDRNTGKTRHRGISDYEH